MAVPARMRHIKNTEPVTKFLVLDSCDKLYDHCVKCCGAKAVKDNEEYSHLGKKIVEASLEVYTLCFQANSVPYHENKITEEQYKERTEKQVESMRLCTKINAWVNLGRRHFQWRKKKIHYWCGLCDETRELIHDWYMKTIKMYEDCNK